MNDEPQYVSEYRRGLRESADARDELQALLAHPGWERLATCLQGWLDDLREQYEKSGPITEGNIYANEYRRAQINMLRSLIDLPHVELAKATEAADALRTTLDQYDEPEGAHYGEEPSEID